MCKAEKLLHCFEKLERPAVLTALTAAQTGIDKRNGRQASFIESNRYVKHTDALSEANNNSNNTPQKCDFANLHSKENMHASACCKSIAHLRTLASGSIKVFG